MARRILGKASGAPAGQFSADDIDYINHLLTGQDQSATDPVDINTTTKFRDSRLQIANPANTANVTVRATDITTAVDFEIRSALVPKTYDIIVYLEDGGSNYVAKRGNIAGAVVSTNTDPAVVIQAALDGLTAARTHIETVFLKGNFTVSTRLNISSYTELVIQGTLKLANSVTTQGSLIRNKNYGVSLDTQIHIRGAGDAIIDGNKAGGATANCIALGGVTDSSISNLTVKNAGTGGRNIYILTENSLRITDRVSIRNVNLSGATDSDLEIAGNADGGAQLIRNVDVDGLLSDTPGHRNIALTNARNCKLTRIYGKGAATHGIDLSYNSMHNTISTFVIETATQHGVNVNTLNSSHNTFSNFRIMSCTLMGIATSATYNSFTNGIVSNSGQDGVRLSTASHWCQLIGITSINNSQGTVNTYSGINVVDSNNCIILGCTCTDDQGTKTQRWGVVFNSLSGSNIALGCQLSGNTQAGSVSDSGTGNIVRECMGASTSFSLTSDNTATISNKTIDVGGGGASGTNNTLLGAPVYPDKKLWGYWSAGVSATTGAAGMLMNWLTTAGTVTLNAPSTTDPSSTRFATGATLGNDALIRGSAASAARWIRGRAVRFKARFRLVTATNFPAATFYAGLASSGANLAGGDDPLSTVPGVLLVARPDRTTHPNFNICYRSSITTYDNTGIAVDNNNWHTIEIRGNSGDTNFEWSLDGSAFTALVTSAQAPGSTTVLAVHCGAETNEAVDKQFDLAYMLVEQSN